jgi:hypothetical protein
MGLGLLSLFVPSRMPDGSEGRSWLVSAAPTGIAPVNAVANAAMITRSFLLNVVLPL